MQIAGFVKPPMEIGSFRDADARTRHNLTGLAGKNSDSLSDWRPIEAQIYRESLAEFSGA